MKKEKMLFVGVDVSKEYSDYALCTGEKELGDRVRRYPNTSRGLKEVRGWVERVKKSYRLKGICVVMEATGVYHLPVARYFSEKGYRVSVVNPARVRHFSSSQQIRTKTDAVDARVIAEFGCSQKELREWVPPTAEDEELVSIVRQVEEITEMITSERNRLEALSVQGSGVEKVRDVVRERMEFLTRQKRELLDHLRRHISGKRENEKSEILHYIRSIPGIGDYGACVIVAEAGEILLNGTKKQLVAHAGISPAKKESGSSVRKKEMISRQGTKRLRKLLFMPTLVAIRHNPVIREFYHRLVAAGKPKKCAVIACMRKLLHIVWGVVRNRTYFDPGWEKRKNPVFA